MPPDMHAGMLKVVFFLEHSGLFIIIRGNVLQLVIKMGVEKISVLHYDVSTPQVPAQMRDRQTEV